MSLTHSITGPNISHCGMQRVGSNMETPLNALPQQTGCTHQSQLPSSPPTHPSAAGQLLPHFIFTLGSQVSAHCVCELQGMPQPLQGGLARPLKPALRMRSMFTAMTASSKNPLFQPPRPNLYVGEGLQKLYNWFLNLRFYFCMEGSLLCHFTPNGRHKACGQR